MSLKQKPEKRELSFAVTVRPRVTRGAAMKSKTSSQQCQRSKTK